MNAPKTYSLIAAVLLVVLHAVLALLPEPPFNFATNLVLLATNLYVLYCASSVLSGRGAGTLVIFVAGYAVLYALVVVVLGKTPLFILLLVVYASAFGSPPLLGFLVIFVISFVVFQPYAFETFIPLALIYALLLKVRRSTSRFMRACLGVGLVALAAVLLPLIHLALQDSPQTLGQTLARPDVQDAIGLSLLSSTAATVIVLLFGVPLAWALSRLESPSKRWIESIVDLPILIPQPVAGIALIVLLGPGGALGEGLERLGLGVSGTFMAVVIAQV
ncbi:MAG: hypothetical protein IT384_28690, partial [Deltaproteobacteria bacterium]|nr:hypothetical protein [Deltaproteobacteria bacterium]